MDVPPGSSRIVLADLSPPTECVCRRLGQGENIDPRSGAVSGGRADQSNVTLDGIDVNDPQFGTAYNSSVRVTLHSRDDGKAPWLKRTAAVAGIDRLSTVRRLRPRRAKRVTCRQLA